MSNDIMVDIETLGTRPGSVILSVGAQRFDGTGPVDLGYYAAIDVLDSIMEGLTIDPDTCAWWARQDPAAINALRMPVTYPVREALVGLANYIPTDARVWAKGPDFDLVLLDTVYKRLGIKTPWYYRNARDVRTILALAPAGYVPSKNPLAHYALEDARHQVHEVIEVLRLRELPLV